MLDVSNVSLMFGSRTLFEGVNIQFSKGNCYGIIGANGAGKSTFLKVLSGEIEPQKGFVNLPKTERMAVLEQDHFKYDEFTVRETVIMGHKRLYEIMKEKERLYSKTDFNDEDGILLGELEGEFAELDGWSAESNAEILLQGLGLGEDFYERPMKDLTGGQKVKVLLAQALFGNPDVLLLDEPTNHLDLNSCRWLENYLLDFENCVLVVSHDRHFLNKVCTHIVDIDFKQVTLFQGNYDFWYEYTQLSLRQLKDQTKKIEARRKELQDFIARFSANASKSKQATSRKKLLENMELPEVKQSSRRYPFISFTQDREIGNDVLFVTDLNAKNNGRHTLNHISFTMERDDRMIEMTLRDISEYDNDEQLTGIVSRNQYFASSFTENSQFHNQLFCVYEIHYADNTGSSGIYYYYVKLTNVMIDPKTEEVHVDYNTVSVPQKPSLSTGSFNLSEFVMVQIFPPRLLSGFTDENSIYDNYVMPLEETCWISSL